MLCMILYIFFKITLDHRYLWSINNLNSCTFLMIPFEPDCFKYWSVTLFSSVTVIRSLVAQQSISSIFLIPPSPFKIINDTGSSGASVSSFAAPFLPGNQLLYIILPLLRHHLYLVLEDQISQRQI